MLQINFFQVFGKNLFALGMLPLFGYLGYFCFNLKSTLEPYSDASSTNPKSAFLINRVETARFGVALGFVLFGKFFFYGK